MQRRKTNFDKRDPSAVGVATCNNGHENNEDDDDEDDNNDDEDGTANLNRVLVERMLLKNSGFNQGSRSVGGTPICLRRKKHDVNKNLSPLRLNDKQSPAVGIMTNDPDAVKRRSNSVRLIDRNDDEERVRMLIYFSLNLQVSYVNGNLVRRQITNTDNTYMTTFASEIALIEADKEADKKYRELILEAENILVNMQKNQNSLPIVPSPSRKFHNGLANKRVELIKSTELNIELALSKSRNSQPELQSGSIKDLEHTSPKRQQFVHACSPIRRFAERNVSLPTAATFQSGSNKSSVDSPLVSKRVLNQQQSIDRSLLRSPRPKICENQDSNDYDGRRTAVTTAETTMTTVSMFNCNGILGSDVDRCATRSQISYFVNRPCAILPHRDSFSPANRKEFRSSRSSNAGKEDGVTSSSSDSEERCDIRRRAPLMTFRLAGRSIFSSIYFDKIALI